MKVLFIGNSHTYFNDMPKLFAEMCKALTGKPAEVTMLAYSGRALRWHTKEYFSIRFALLYGQYDYCVIQQLGHPFPGLEKTEPDVQTLVSLCRLCGTNPVLYMTWAKKDEPEKIGEISSAYRLLAERSGAFLAPIGELYEKLRISHPEIDLYWRDGAHASVYGTYLIAATFAALLTESGDLSVLSDDTFDFDAQFSITQPHAEEDVGKLRFRIDPQIASVLRNTAASVICSKEMT